MTEQEVKELISNEIYKNIRFDIDLNDAENILKIKVRYGEDILCDEYINLSRYRNP